MDQERFDKVALALSRRRIVGGALASVLGVGAARLAAAKGDKKGKGKPKRKKKSKAEAICFPGACPPGSCCTPTPAGNPLPACTTTNQQLIQGTICGDAGGSGTCRTCPPGTRCDDGPGGLRCRCSVTTCPDGCCIPASAIPGQTDDICVRNGSGTQLNIPGFFSGANVCGVGGGICNICSVGTIFSGCCDALGGCNAGTSGTNCGSRGALCRNCQAGGQTNATCVSQVCTGLTTTAAPTTAAPTTTPAPCGASNCANGCCSNGVCQPKSKATCGLNGVACVACGKNQKCNGQGVCKKKK